MAIEFRSAPLDSGDGALLVGAMVDELAVIYDGLDINDASMPKASANELGPPHGDFLVGYDGSDAVCCGGLKRLPDGAVEIKRMYVVPEARGKGLARTLLVALEDRARAMGFTTARLDTGPKQPRARALYESAGYTQIPNFNANPMADYFGEKQL